MNARILTAAAVATAFCGVLPARAADSRLLSLMMPDAKVIAGVNVDQARVSPFGQWVLSQMQPQEAGLQQLKTLTNFDPTHDVSEVLVATSGGAQQHSGLLAARGNFDTAKINALALAQPGAVSETYNGVTIVEDPKKSTAFAFLDGSVVIAGDIANVKAAIDRQAPSKQQPLPADVLAQINSWSTTEDAWVVTAVPPASLAPAAGMPPIPGVGAQGQNNAFANIQRAAAGVKFGANVVVKAQAQAANGDEAKQMGDALKLLASLAQMQANADPNILAVVKSLAVDATGSALNVSLSVPQDTLVQILKSGAQAHPGPRHPAARKKM